MTKQFIILCVYFEETISEEVFNIYCKAEL